MICTSVNLQSGEVVVGGKRQKLPRRRQREVEHEEDLSSSPSNSYCEVVTLLVGEGASGFVRTEQKDFLCEVLLTSRQMLLMTRVEPSITRASSQMNDIDNHTPARNTLSINQQESSSYEHQQSMVLKGITLVAIRTRQESHTRVTNISGFYNATYLSLQVGLTNNSNAANLTPTTDHPIRGYQNTRRDPIHLHSSRRHEPGLPNNRNVTNIDGKYKGSELGVLLKFHILKLLENTGVVSKEKILSVLQLGFFEQRYVTQYTLPLIGSSSLSVQEIPSG
nr:hypothetical protein [Tanacetum cinerariifolium]